MLSFKLKEKYIVCIRDKVPNFCYRKKLHSLLTCSCPALFLALSLPGSINSTTLGGGWKPALKKHLSLKNISSNNIFCEKRLPTTFLHKRQYSQMYYIHFTLHLHVTVGKTYWCGGRATQIYSKEKDKLLFYLNYMVFRGAKDSTSHQISVKRLSISFFQRR